MCPDSSPMAGPIGQVVLASRVLGEAGVDDLVWGHVSVRDPKGRGAWMKAAGWGFDEVTPDRVVLVGFNGEVLHGEGPVHIEYHIHTELFRRRPEVRAVVHTHAPAAVTFAALNVPLRAISHEGCLFVHPDIPRFTASGALIDSVELGQLLAQTVGDAAGALIPRHGLVAVGEDVELAVMTALFLDRTCRVQLPAEAAGGPREWSDAQEALIKRATCCGPAQLRAGWRYLARRVTGREPLFERSVF
jgi:ribulose-5-phosphate 4-epimerase/fuculose-1-phosphate aldolase